MVDEFFVRYAERKLGRSLTEDEQEEVSGFVTRRQVREWVFPILNASKPQREYRKKESIEDEQSVIDSESEEE